MKFKHLATLFLAFVILSGFGSFTAFAEPDDYTGESSSYSEGSEPTPQSSELPQSDVTLETQPLQSQQDTEPAESNYEPDYEPDYQQESEPESTYEEPEEDIYTYEYPTYSSDEWYTEPSTLPRIDFLNGESGNVAIGVGLWVLIIVGVITVAAILIVTHRRKKS